jgi:hypothetical protein
MLLGMRRLQVSSVATSAQEKQNVASSMWRAGCWLELPIIATVLPRGECQGQARQLVQQFVWICCHLVKGDCAFSTGMCLFEIRPWRAPGRLPRKDKTAGLLKAVVV